MESVETTVDTLKLLAPTVTESLSDDTIQALIDNARLIAIGDEFPKTVEVDGEILPIRDMATRYMAAHLCSMNGQAGNGVTSEKVGDLERHYADRSSLKWLQSSEWGQAYLRLYRLYGGGPSYYDLVQH